MTLTLHAIDPARNRQRFYTLQLAPNLFGEWSLIRTWGRIGTGGRTVIDWHAPQEAAEAALRRIFQAKQRRGYVARSPLLSAEALAKADVGEQAKRVPFRGRS